MPDKGPNIEIPVKELPSLSLPAKGQNIETPVKGLYHSHCRMPVKGPTFETPVERLRTRTLPAITGSTTEAHFRMLTI